MKSRYMYRDEITLDQLDYMYSMLYRAQNSLMSFNDEYEEMDQSNEVRMDMFRAKHAAIIYATKEVINFSNGFIRSAQSYYRELSKLSDSTAKRFGAKLSTCVSANRKLRDIANHDNTLPKIIFANDFYDRYFDSYYYRKTFNEIFTGESETLRHTVYRYTGSGTGMSDSECFAAIQCIVMVAKSYLVLGKDIIAANENSTNSYEKGYIIEDLRAELESIKRGIRYLSDYTDKLNGRKDE